jgi:diacylglycerol kinase
MGFIANQNCQMINYFDGVRYSLLGLVVVIGQEDWFSHFIALLVVSVRLVWYYENDTLGRMIIRVLVVWLGLHVVALLIGHVLLSIVHVSG